MVELRLGVGDAPVVENVSSSNGSATLSSPTLSSCGANSSAWSFVIALLDRRLALGVVERLALGRGEHDVQDGALLGGELGLDQVGRALRVRARDLELVAQLAAERGDEGDQRRR